MKRPATKKNGDPQPCNRRYYGFNKSGSYGTMKHCQKPTGHKGRCGSQIIK
jgi:hypothetical protein